MRDLERLMFAAGVVLALAGLLIWKSGGIGFLGRLPGDISIQRPGYSFSFPITTCILISIIMTVIMMLIRR